MIVRANRLLRVIEGEAEDQVGPVGDHLVQIHVMAGAGTGLEGIDHELIAVLTGQHFVGSLDDRVGQLLVEQAEIAVDNGCGALNGGLRPYEGGIRFCTADREIQHGALGLRAIQRIGRHLHLAQ